MGSLYWTRKGNNAMAMVMVVYPKRRDQRLNGIGWEVSTVWTRGPSPRFNDRQFERVFRISRKSADELLLLCANQDPFFTQRQDIVTGEMGICPKVKILFALQLMAYGASASAFQSYFQIGESTANQSWKILSFVIAKHSKTKRKYFRLQNSMNGVTVSKEYSAVLAVFMFPGGAVIRLGKGHTKEQKDVRL